MDPRGRGIATFINVRHRLDKLLGTPSCVGLALVEGFYSGEPWLSPQQIAANLRVSDDTTRRRLNDLVNVGRARSTSWEGRGKLYRIDRDIAAKVKEYIDLALPQSGTSPVSSREPSL